MKLKYNFAVREIAGDYVMVPLGESALKFAGMISTSETGALLADALKHDVTKEELLQKLVKEYDVDEIVAMDDINEFIVRLQKLDILTE